MLRPLDEATPDALARAVDARIADGFTASKHTHPFREMAARRVRPAGTVVAMLAAVSTVHFAGVPQYSGYDTDH